MVWSGRCQLSLSASTRGEKNLSNKQKIKIQKSSQAICDARDQQTTTPQDFWFLLGFVSLGLGLTLHIVLRKEISSLISRKRKERDARSLNASRQFNNALWQHFSLYPFHNQDPFFSGALLCFSLVSCVVVRLSCFKMLRGAVNIDEANFLLWCRLIVVGSMPPPVSSAVILTKASGGNEVSAFSVADAGALGPLPVLPPPHSTPLPDSFFQAARLKRRVDSWSHLGVVGCYHHVTDPPTLHHQPGALLLHCLLLCPPSGGKPLLKLEDFSSDSVCF